MYALVQYFQSLYRNEDIYELEGVHIANFEAQAAQTLWEFVGIWIYKRMFEYKQNMT